MSSRITTISLDDRTVQIKNKMGGNFSKFVRECCLRWDALHNSQVCEIAEKIDLGLLAEGVLYGGLCTPSPTRWCMSCWPDGKPAMDHWRKYKEMLKCVERYPSQRQVGEVYEDKLTYYFPEMKNWDQPQDWIQAQAKVANGELFSVANIDLEGNAKPHDRSTSKKKSKSFISKMLNFL